MRQLAATLLTLVALAAPSAASAQLTVGGRLGVASTFGDVGPFDGPFNGYVLFPEVPLTLDVGYLAGRFAFGAYFTYGPGPLGDQMDEACTAANAECSAYTLRAGLGAAYRADFSRGLEGWGGLYAGWARAAIVGTPAVEYATDGISVGLQGGIDFGGSSLRFGPYLQLGATRFLRATYGGTELDAEDHVFRGEFGLRGRFRL